MTYAQRRCLPQYVFLIWVLITGGLPCLWLLAYIGIHGEVPALGVHLIGWWGFVFIGAIFAAAASCVVDGLTSLFRKES